MNKIVHLSITRKDVPTVIDVVQYATKPDIIFIIDDYEVKPGTTASLYIEKPDGTKVYNACTVDGNHLIYESTTQSFPLTGVSICQLQLIESEDTAMSFLIIAHVTKNIVDSSAVESQDEFTALEQALQTVSQYDGRIEVLENKTEYLWEFEQDGSVMTPLGTDVVLGDSRGVTSNLTIWGNQTNYVAITTRNTQDGGSEKGIYVRSNHIRVGIDNELVYAIYPNKTETKTVTGTTNANGNLNLGLDPSQYHVLSVVAPNPYLAYHFCYTAAGGATQTWAKILNNDSGPSPAGSKSITVTVYYEANH